MQRKNRKNASHAKREYVSNAAPLHVTMRLKRGLPSMRRKHAYRAVESAFRKGNERFGFRLLHFSVMSNHLHLIVEADDNLALSRGMQGLTIRIAKGLNRVWNRRGSVFAERFFARVLKKMAHIRRAMLYVLQNARKHGIRLPAGVPDPYSSAAWFPWLEEYAKRYRRGSSPVVRPYSDLTHMTVRRYRLSLSDRPGTNPDYATYPQVSLV